MYNITRNNNVYSCCGRLYINDDKIRNVKCPYCGSKINVKCEVPFVYVIKKEK